MLLLFITIVIVATIVGYKTVDKSFKQSIRNKMEQYTKLTYNMPHNPTTIQKKWSKNRKQLYI